MYIRYWNYLGFTHITVTTDAVDEYNDNAFVGESFWLVPGTYEGD